MKVLHYALGFSPYRTGGLTKYCMDLMQTQLEMGYEVSLLWPGRMNFIGQGKTTIYESVYKKGNIEIVSYELVNPLPVPLDEGIIEVDKFIASVDLHIYYDFLKKVMPDAIHIHTLMGLHEEFISAAQQLHIKTMFTTHDYFGLCPKVTLFGNGHVCNEIDCNSCARCNKSALSLKKIKLMQSVPYRVLKDTALMKKARARHRKNFFEELTEPDHEQNITADRILMGKYRKLRNYYIKMLSEIDFIHFNSTISEQIYKRYFTPKNSEVINIAHRGIDDNRKIKKFDHDKIRIAYLAPAKPFKGSEVLIEALDGLWSEGRRNFLLQSYSIFGRKKPYLYERDGFHQNELEKIFDCTDVLVAPSLWYETYGFTVLEALSYGVPVIVSNHVGVKDIIPEGGGLVVEATAGALKDAIGSLTMDKLKKMNEVIMSDMNLPDSLMIAKKIEEGYLS